MKICTTRRKIFARSNPVKRRAKVIQAVIIYIVVIEEYCNIEIRCCPARRICEFFLSPTRRIRELKSRVKKISKSQKLRNNTILTKEYGTFR